MDHDGVRPDMVVLGKALSGGTMPVSPVKRMYIAFHIDDLLPRL